MKIYTYSAEPIDRVSPAPLGYGQSTVSVEEMALAGQAFAEYLHSNAAGAFTRALRNQLNEYEKEHKKIMRRIQRKGE